MRDFIVVGHKATTSPDFSLEDIPGTSGRLDILCRCINSAFVLSHGIRRDVRIFLVLLGGESPKIMLLRGDELKHLNPDERTTAALLKKALALAIDGTGWTRSTPGIYVRPGALADALMLDELKGKRIVYLREDGEDVRSADISGEAVFVLGDHTGMMPEEEALLMDAGAGLLSVGTVSLHADHCIVIINNSLDTGTSCG